MNKRDEIQKELREQAPLLARLKEQLPGPEEPPQDYFTMLPDQVWEQIKWQPAPPVHAAKPKQWWQLLLPNVVRPWPAIGVAMVAVLIAIGIYWLQPIGTPAAQAALAELSVDEMTAYMLSHIHEFEEDLLVQIVDFQAEKPLLPFDLNEAETEELLREIIKDLDTETLEQLL
ncbi:MAG TPA: hypothetical protein PKC76_04950 [Saprospiraceae bacterium]|nr:hypothetical protein [Saprospiraceae bacterium]HMP23455.1 hypothetical protein [Saprospiraceae bacterium]